MKSNFQTAGSIALGLAVLVGIRAAVIAGEPDSKEKHWAYQEIRRPAVPAASGPDGGCNPVDRFILARLNSLGIKPVAPAERRTLIRRVYFDLIGLPPKPEEVEAFLEDRSPGAMVRVVDRLLADPRYGERWGRHWLDVARFAETNGYERDGDKPNAWRYRDYVIASLNHDKPYDRFLTEQLAGDEIDGSDASAQIATTFLRLGTWDDEPAESKVDRYDQLDDVLGTTATAFLGITLRCARCHDHKFEPFSQADYYRMLAVFEPLKRPQRNRADLDRPVGTAPELAAYYERADKADADFRETWGRIEGLVKIEIGRLVAPASAANGDKPGVKRSSLPPYAMEVFRTDPSKRTADHREAVKTFAEKLLAEVREIAPAEVRDALRPLEARLSAIKAARRELPRAYIWYEPGPTPVTHVLKRGNPEQQGIAVDVGLPKVLAARQPGRPRPTSKSSGRRLWLARWLTSHENPLAARVLVNRLWQFHFGRGLVASSNDLGVMGDAPTHPELLDWLAAESMAIGWRLKPLHRLIVLSETYGRSSAQEPHAAQRNAENLMLWRHGQRRLEAEAIRDSILAISGELYSRMAGPGFYPTLPRAVLEGQSRPGQGWGQSDVREQARRSIYIFAKRSLGVPEIELLDAPDTTSSCEQRIVSTTGPQALAFLNGSFIHGQSRQFAARLVAEAGEEAKRQVDRAFALALGRPPRPEESHASLEFLANQEKQIKTESSGEKAPRGDARRRALEAFCLVILNSNELAYTN